MNKALMFLTGAGVGGGLMFMFDPHRGRQRRTLVRDKVTGTLNDAGDAVRKRSRDVGNRVYGAYASARSMFGGGETEPGILLARLRSRIGHVVSNPRAVRVAVENGRVVLSGAVLASEAGDLTSAVRSIAGVREIDNRIEVRESMEGSTEEHRGKGGSTTWRAVAGATGGALAVFGLSHRRQLLGRAASAAGFGLLARSASGRGFRALLKAVHIAA
ncbi:MAG TPA: BON domain-containing protein [Bryobacteraceae bacterium]